MEDNGEVVRVKFEGEEGRGKVRVAGKRGRGEGKAVRFRQTAFSTSNMHLFPALQLRTVPAVLYCITCTNQQHRSEHIVYLCLCAACFTLGGFGVAGRIVLTHFVMSVC